VPMNSFGVPFGVEYIPAAHQGPVRNGERIDWLVVHDMEAPEKPKVARTVALWFASSSAPKASAHYCVDDTETIQCVKENVVAWAAPGANRRGIHVELPGYARQSAEEWIDEYGMRLLNNAADLIFDICTRHDIPFQKLSPEDLKNGHRGLCGHVDVTNAFNGGKGHTDPGPHFPWDLFIQMLRDRMRDTLPDRGDDPNA